MAGTVEGTGTATAAWDVRRILDPPRRTLPGALTALAAEFGDKVAVEGPDGALSHRALADRTFAVAAAVRECGLPDDATVALVLGHNAGAVPALLGVVHSGHLASPFDAREPVERMSGMLQASGARLVVTEHAHRDAARAASGDAPLLLLDELPDAAPAPAVTDRDEDIMRPAYVMFTSGTTGVPKGVVFPAAMLTVGSVPWAVQERMTPANRTPQFNSIAYAGGLARVLTTWLSGGSSHAFDLKEHGLRALPAWMRERAITVLTVQSSAFRSLAEHITEPVASVHRVNLGGEATYGTDVTLARDVFGPDVVVANMLGSTEAGGIAAFEVLPGAEPDDAQLPVGTAGERVEIELVDDDDHPVVPGTTGRIVVVKDTMALGYWDDPSLTAAHFFTAASGRPAFRTSDLGRLRDDGALELVGRLDARVKVRGALVAPDEVERVIVGQRGVKAAAVIASPTDDGHRLVAYVVPQAGASLTPWQVRRDVASRLPSTMVPGSVLLVTDLPRTSRGKLERAALPPPPPMRAYREPIGAEVRLADVFADVLGADRVGADDDFFDLGGDSLGAVELVTEVVERLGVPMTTSTLLDAPTPALLAPRIAARRAHDAPVAVPLGPGAVGAPCFFATGAGAPALTMHALAVAIAERPFFALQARGLEEAAVPDRSVGALARRDLTAVRRAAPVGPYLVGGYSFGGLVAFELACLLHRAGERVPLVVLVDSPAPGAFRPAVLRVGARAADAYARPGAETRRRSLGVATREVTRAASRDLRRRARLATAGVVPRGGLAQYDLFVSLHERAAVRYRPRTRFPGPALVVRSNERKRGTQVAPDLGWSAWVDGEITVHDVDATHLDLVRAPVVDDLGARLRAAFTAAVTPGVRP